MKVKQKIEIMEKWSEGAQDLENVDYYNILL